MRILRLLLTPCLHAGIKVSCALAFTAFFSCSTAQKLPTENSVKAPSVAPSAQKPRTTWLMTDVTKRMETPYCNNNDCIEGHNNSSKVILDEFLPGTPNNFKTPTNYAGEGYWHIVINTLKCEGPSKGPGSTGSIRVCTEGLKDNEGAYYLFWKPGDCQTCTKDWTEGEATHYWRKFSDYKTYNKFKFKDEYWDRTISRWTFGPVKSRQEAESADGKDNNYHTFYDIGPENTGMTPVTYRARVWVTLDKDFVPPTNPNDPVGAQP